jgi:hypothetical protein
LNTVLRGTKPDSIFCSRTCRIASIEQEGMELPKHVLEQNILSGLVPRRTVFKQAYPNRPESEFHPSDGRHRRTSEIGLFPLHVRNIIHDLRVDLRFPLLLQDASEFADETPKKKKKKPTPKKSRIAKDEPEFDEDGNEILKNLGDP